MPFSGQELGACQEPREVPGGEAADDGLAIVVAFPEAQLSALIAVFFFMSVISVVTGSTSLITVPGMITLGVVRSAIIGTLLFIESSRGHA
jgi:hypothetical protein